MTAATTSGKRRSTVVMLTAALVLLVTIVARLPVGARASAIRSVSSAATASNALTNGNAAVSAAVDTPRWTRYRRDAPRVPDSVPTSVARTIVRKKRTLLKLKPLVVLPAKVALGAGAKLVAGAKLGAKAVGLGAKALGVGAVGLKAVKKVAKVTVKAATALGIKAVLLNFLFQKVNQVIDFKTRLLSNLDQRNRQQNAQFLSPVLPQSSSAAKSSGSVGNKDDSAATGFAPVPPSVEAAAADASGFVAVAPQPGFAPGSDLIASPPPPPAFGTPSTPGFGAAPPPDFGAALTLSAFEADPSSSNFGVVSQSGYGATPFGFSATNDDGSPSSETSF